ncbi:hypothetical protein SRHO_G00077580 [Serrasalmus rhombeus]
MATDAWLWTLGLLAGPVWVCSLGLSCALQSRAISGSLYKEGDVIIGGLFPVHFEGPEPDHKFTQRVQAGHCQSADLRSFRWLQTMIFTVEEINRDPALLPNLTLGYLAADTCLTERSTLSAALSLVTGQEEIVSWEQCTEAPTVPVIIGDARSSASIVVAETLGVFGIPMVSYFASCACLSDHTRYPTFLRTVPSDAFQAKAMARLLRLLGWSWVGVISGDDAYGKSGVQILLQELEGSDVCVDYIEVIPKSFALNRIRRIVERIQSSKARVVVTFAISPDMEVLLREVVKQNVTDRQWIATEAWSTSSQHSALSGTCLAGTLGFALRKVDIKGLGSYLAQLGFDMYQKEPLVQNVWEELFGCRFGEETQSRSVRSLCPDLEKVEEQEEIYSDINYNVYKAVYAIANAIQNMLTCQPGKGPFGNGECPEINPIRPKQLLYYLKEVKFTTPVGEPVYFDENGDPSASYDIINWHMGAEGKMEFVQVGQFDAARGPEQDFQLDLQKVVWGGGWDDESVYSAPLQRALWVIRTHSGPECFAVNTDPAELNKDTSKVTLNGLIVAPAPQLNTLTAFQAVYAGQALLYPWAWLSFMSNRNGFVCVTPSSDDYGKRSAVCFSEALRELWGDGKAKFHLSGTAGSVERQISMKAKLQEFVVCA